MNGRFIAGSLLGTIAILLASCADLRGEGGTSETESEVAFREIRVDSLLRDWNRPDSVATVAILRLDSTNFPFDRASYDGSDVSVERFDGPLLPFRIVYWDAFAHRARIEVRLDPLLQMVGTKFLLRWGLLDSVREDSSKVWGGLDSATRLSVASVVVDDFEHSGFLSPLSEASDWNSIAADSATITSFGIELAGKGRPGKALHVAYSSEKGFVFAYLPLANGARNLRSLDSIVLWARGNGTVGVSLDRELDGKAWTFRKVDSLWTRIRIRPQDFDSADYRGGNVGWDAVRDQVARLTIFPSGGGSQLWLDDIRFYGVNRDDFH